MGLGEVVAVVTIVAGVITIIWFIRDIRRENGKILKEILRVSERIEASQREGFKALAQIQKECLEIQKESLKIAERGFETLGKILLKIEENTRKPPQ